MSPRSGFIEMHINGKRVGSDYFTPGDCDFRKRTYYLTYDVTGMLKSGDNAIGAILGEGWYSSYLAFTGKRNWYGGRPRLLAQINIEFADGSKRDHRHGRKLEGAVRPDYRSRHADGLRLRCPQGDAWLGYRCFQ